MAEVVDGEVDFVAVWGEFALGDAHDAGVSDQDVDLAVGLVKDLLCGRADAGEACVVHVDEGDASRCEYFGESFFGFDAVADGQEERGACREESTSCLEADS